jgi:epoxyqueuosine reductase QueG
VAHPSKGLIGLSRLAQEAGLGYIGKSRLLLMPELGSRLIISAILTSIENLPFSQNNEHEWIRQYCKRCIKCIRGCLDEALVEQASLSEKANLMDGKCIGCSQGCTYCIGQCIFSKEDYKLIKTKQIRLEAKLREKGLL